MAAPTSAAGFVGEFGSGPFHEPVAVPTARYLAASYGNDAEHTIAGQAIRLFLANGGKEAHVVRVHAGEVAAGLEALAAVRDVNLLCLPDTTSQPDLVAAADIGLALRLAEQRNAIVLVDPPQRDADRDDPAALAQWVSANPHLRHPNAAVYAPRLVITSGGTTTARPTSGAVAGIYARTDDRRGVWEAPAGPRAQLIGVAGLSRAFDAADHEQLTPLGINVLRDFRGDTVVWGARTLSPDPQWTHVPVRRLSLFIEESIDQGTRWASFEPNAEGLWAELHRAIENFLLDLWRSGALTGATPEEAFFVRCDRSTMTADDIDRGDVIALVGFAPLKPGEFVVIKISQKTADGDGS